MTALPDIKMLNKMSETTIRAAQKQVDPPLLVPDDSFILPIKTVPSGLNFYRSGTRDRIEPLNIGANNPLGLNMEEQRRGAIRSAFYVDQLIMGQGPQMTATEVVQRTEEKDALAGSKYVSDTNGTSTTSYHQGVRYSCPRSKIYART